MLVAATGPLCPSVHPSGIHLCVSVSLFSTFALCVRLTCLFKTSQFAQTVFSVHCTHQRRDVLKDLALLTLQNPVMQKLLIFLYYDLGRKHNYIVSSIFKLQISMRTALFCGFTDVTHSTHSATKQNTASFSSRHF